MLTDIVWEGPDWINPSQVWDKWRVLVDEVMNFRSSIKCGKMCSIAGLRGGVNGTCALSRFYATQCGSLLPKFRDNLSVQSSRVEQYKNIALTSWAV
jgi:hypothetical protein